MKKKLLKKLMVLALSAVTAFSAVPVATVTAAGNPYPTTQDVDRDGLYEIPCTRFAWQCVYDRQGIALPAWGNAVGWWQNAINQGYAVGNEPVPGSIAVWSGDYYGHVAYVTANLGNNRFTVDEGGRTDKDQTSSHGVAYGYTLTSAVGGRRPYDSNKVLLGFIYPGVRVPGKPYVSVNPGKANQTTTFSWNATSYARYYDVYVYKAGESNPTQFQYGVNGTSWSCTLPAGNYRVAVASVNHAQYAYTFSDSVNFTVQAAPVTHTHSYQRVTVKATTTANGYTQEQCSCGSIQNKQIIYYPKKIQLSRTSYTYNGKVKKPTVKVTDSNNRVISADNYTVTYSAGRKYVGTYRVTVRFKGNYSGTVTKTFKITGKAHKHSYKKQVKKATTSRNGYVQYLCSCGAVTGKKTIYYPKTIKLSATSYTYDGKVKTPKVKVTGANKKTISSGNYKVSYSRGRKNVGTYKVTVKFKGNYSGTVTKTFKIKAKPKNWVYVDTLPKNITSDKYTIQYKHTYQKTTSSYVNDGGVYESVRPLETSASRQLVGYYYYHFCGPNTGKNVNFAQTGSYVHFDSVAASQVTVAASGADGDDPSITYYLLNWNGNGSRVWCSSGTTCNGAYGSHGARGQAWYRMNQYQNKKLQTQTTTSESDWTTGKDSTAVKTVYRYKAK